jgi:hypothetical protein
MFTLRKGVADIRNIADSGENNYSFRITDYQIAFWFHEVRAMLISQAVSKRQDISDVWVQSIPCLELELVDSSDCCIVTTKCYILKTKRRIPITVETAADNLILSVTNPMSDIITKSNRFEAKYNKYNKYTAEKPQWFLQDGYLYITNDKLLEYVNVFAIFENPEELSEFTLCNNISSCFSWDSPYPVSLKMANDITNIVMQTKVMPFLQMPQDTSNDALSQNQIGKK